MDIVTYYLPDNGRITVNYTGQCLSEMDDLYPDFGRVNGTFTFPTHYILDGEPTERPPSPVTLTDLTLHNLPTGGVLFIDGTRYEITDETVELEFPLPGTFALRVECFPFLDWTDEVVV